eukprot:m.33867 g.33867  ORF g.33867 m.33867 type:complete len:836 (+) comp9495_c0_seq1:54-2561(+)
MEVGTSRLPALRAGLPQPPPTAHIQTYVRPGLVGAAALQSSPVPGTFTQRADTLPRDDVPETDPQRYVTVNLEKVISLLTHKHTVANTDRHVHILGKLAKHMEPGVSSADIPNFVKLLSICAERIRGGSTQYTDSLCGVIRALGRPWTGPPPAEADSVLHLFEHLVEFLSVASLAEASCATLVALHERLLGGETALIALRDSHVPLQLADALPTLGAAVRPAILEILSDDVQWPTALEEISRSTCGVYLCRTLADPDAHSPAELAAACDVLTAVLDGPSPAAWQTQLNNDDGARLIRDAVRRAAAAAETLAARHRRNDIVGLALVLAAVPPLRDALRRAGLLDTVLRLALWQESGRRHPDTRNMRLSNAPEDFELHKLAMTICIQLVDPESSGGAKVLALLFSQVSPDDSSRWTPAQREELQLMSLALVGAVAASNLAAYREQRGNTRLLSLLESTLTAPLQPPRAANTLYNAAELRNGLLGAHTDFAVAWPQRAAAQYCLRALARVCSAGDASLCADLGDQGALGVLVAYLERPLDDTAELVEVVMRTDALQLVVALCAAVPHNKELFGVAGVAALMPYLRTPPAVTCVPEWQVLLGAAVTCVWTCVAGCALTEPGFLAREGVFVLMDVLAACPSSLHPLVLGALSDLTENPEAVKHLQAWRGPGPAAPLLLALWRAEEQAMAVTQAEHGVLADDATPLAGRTQRRSSLTLPPGGVAASEVFENRRGKLYALVGRAGAAGVTDPADRVTAVAVAHYLRLKRGEAWTEIRLELASEGVAPTEADAALLGQMEAANGALVQHIRSEQSAILQGALQQELAREAETYTALLSSPVPR